MAAERSLPYSQQPATCPYPDSDQPSPCPRPTSLRSILILSFFYAWVFEWYPLTFTYQNPVCAFPRHVRAICSANSICLDLNLLFAEVSR